MLLAGWFSLGRLQPHIWPFSLTTIGSDIFLHGAAEAEWPRVCMRDLIEAGGLDSQDIRCILPSLDSALSALVPLSSSCNDPFLLGNCPINRGHQELRGLCDNRRSIRRADSSVAASLVASCTLGS